MHPRVSTSAPSHLLRPATSYYSTSPVSSLKLFLLPPSSPVRARFALFGSDWSHCLCAVSHEGLIHLPCFSLPILVAASVSLIHLSSHEDLSTTSLPLGAPPPTPGSRGRVGPADTRLLAHRAPCIYPASSPRPCVVSQPFPRRKVSVYPVFRVFLLTTSLIAGRDWLCRRGLGVPGTPKETTVSEGLSRTFFDQLKADPFAPLSKLLLEAYGGLLVPPPSFGGILARSLFHLTVYCPSLNVGPIPFKQPQNAPMRVRSPFSLGLLKLLSRRVFLALLGTYGPKGFCEDTPPSSIKFVIPPRSSARIWAPPTSPVVPRVAIFFRKSRPLPFSSRRPPFFRGVQVC